jgi:uncharacterized protein YneF (UPF0154 family)
MQPVERHIALVLGSAAGFYLCMRIQFGFEFSPHISEELLIICIAAVISLPFAAVLYAITRLVEKKIPRLVANLLVPVIAILLSICIGLWTYMGFLHRSIDIALSRDWPFILSFGFMGLAYALIYLLHQRS